MENFFGTNLRNRMFKIDQIRENFRVNRDGRKCAYMEKYDEEIVLPGNIQPKLGHCVDSVFESIQFRKPTIFTRHPITYRLCHQ